MDNNNNVTNHGKSSLGMEENIAALLSYILGFITGIIFYVLEKESKFVKFHAMQSIIFSVALMVISFILGLIPIIGWLLSLLIPPLSLILWIVLLVKAYKYEYFKIPVIGDIAENQVK